MNLYKASNHMDTEMTMYIRNIQTAIAKEKDYGNYVHTFQAYKDYLEARVAGNPSDVDAVCQLAAVYNELRFDTVDCIAPLEILLRDYASKLNETDKSRIYTNLAFYYETGSECEHYLREAISFEPNIPNAYDALGKLCLAVKKFDEALPLFKRAYELDNDLKYRYNYAVALYENDFWKEAQAIFADASHRRIEEIRERSLYGDGVCSFYLGDQNRALAIANDLAARGEDNDWIMESDVADLYFLCGEYNRHNEMYDNSRIQYYPNASILAPYFYCLKSQGKMKKLAKEYQAIIAEKDDEINDIENDKKPDYDKDDLIKRYRQEKEEITEVYKKITENNWIPNVKPELCCIYGCYLIDCSRHQKV